MKSAPKYPIQDDIEVPQSIQDSWQAMLDTLSEVVDVPAALIMCVHGREIEVLGRSSNEDNVYKRGEKAPLDTGLYCETVMDRKGELLVPNALADPEWNHNPDIELGMISYLGLPLRWPGGELFGTICILDNKENHHSDLHRRLLGQFQNAVELALSNIFEAHQKEARTDKALRESESQYRRLVENLPEIVYSFSDKAGGLYYSPRVKDILGYAPEHLREHPFLWHDSTHPDDLPMVDKAITELQNGKNFDLQYRISDASGNWHWLHDRNNTIQILEGEVRIDGLATDITESKMTDERLYQADKMDALGNLAGGIAHDLKNMLFPIFSLTSMTLKDLPEESRAYRRLLKVVQATERAKSLVEKIHAFSYKDVPGRDKVDLCTAVKETLEILRPSIRSNIKIVTDFCPDDLSVLVDIAQLETSIMNLASNAADAMERRTGVLRFATSVEGVGEDQMMAIHVPRAGTYARLTVSDTGAGMDEETRKRIFEPYFTTKERGHGTGLGLAMVQKVVVESGGAINVTSVQGEGTTFEIYMPLDEGSPG